MSVQVSDLQRSKDFYTKAFGLKVRMEEANLVQLGSETHGFLVIRKDTPAAKVDHFAISVDGMPLMRRENSLYMEWCLECHREPERFVRPREFVFSMDWQPPPDRLALGRKLIKEYRIEKLTSCSVCHR